MTVRQVCITHTTAYSYRNAVVLGPHRLMLRPRETRELRLIAFDIEVAPAARIAWSHDVPGNAVALATFESMSDTLTINARMRLELSAPEWPVFPIAASAISFPFRYSAYERADLGALASPQYADHSGRLAAWVEAFVMNRPTDTLSLLKDVAYGISAQIAYQSREAEGTQGPLETLDSGQGTCRDFAVLFAEAVRTLGLGARLVSGYLFDPDGDRLGTGAAGSTHAWTEVFVPGAGWIPFDPTNRALGAANLVPVSVARRIEQVAPVTGSFQGAGADRASMDVKVSIEEC